MIHEMWKFQIMSNMYPFPRGRRLKDFSLDKCLKDLSMNQHWWRTTWKWISYMEFMIRKNLGKETPI